MRRSSGISKLVIIIPNIFLPVYFDTGLLTLSGNVSEVIAASDCLVMAVPSAYIAAALEGVDRKAFSRQERVISAIKGILPDHNLLLNEWLETEFDGSRWMITSP